MLTRLLHLASAITGRYVTPDHEFAFAIDLTTIAQPTREQGAVAADLLMELIEQRRCPHGDAAAQTADRAIVDPPLGRPARPDHVGRRADVVQLFHWPVGPDPTAPHP